MRYVLCTLRMRYRFAFLLDSMELCCDVCYVELYELYMASGVNTFGGWGHLNPRIPQGMTWECHRLGRGGGCNQIIWVYPLNSHLIYPLNSSPKLLNYFLSPLLYFTPFLPRFSPFPLLFPIQRVLTAFSVFSCTAYFWLGQSQASRPVAPV